MLNNKLTDPIFKVGTQFEGNIRDMTVKQRVYCMMLLLQRIQACALVPLASELAAEATKDKNRLAVSMGWVDDINALSEEARDNAKLRNEAVSLLTAEEKQVLFQREKKKEIYFLTLKTKKDE